MEGAAKANEKKEQQKDQILATMKAVQEDLTAVQSVKTLQQQTIRKQTQPDQVMPDMERLSGPVHVVAKNVGEKRERREEKRR